MSFLAANSGDASDSVRPAPNDAALIADLKRAVSDLFDAREQCHSLASQLDDLNALFAQCGMERDALRAHLSQARSVLEELRPIIKSVLVEREELDDSILSRIADALAPAPSGAPRTPRTL